MGQQQLLLLVLSTVIVGLATVAGIQAFSENQAQADQDALTQRGVTIVSDMKAAINKPTQLGGVDSDNSAKEALQAAGYDTDNATIDVPGATGGNCSVDTFAPGSDPALSVSCSGGEATQTSTVNMGSNGNITTTIGTTSGSGGNSGS
jgi:hypothetical protein